MKHVTTYWQQHKLSFDPFMTEHTNEAAYMSPKYEQQLDLLAHLINNEDKIQLVTGLTGIGKSTMMRLLMKELADASGICKVYGGATITPMVLQELIVRHLGLKVDTDKPSVYQQVLQNKMMQMQHRNEHFFLLIDNAHKLPKASLDFLLTLMSWQKNTKHVIHVALFGGPQLEAIYADLTSIAMGEHATHTIRLEPLSEEETKQYIMHRLTLAGWHKAFPISDAELTKIMQISKGIPSKINYIVKQLLLQKISTTSEQKIVINKQKMFKQLAVGGGIVLGAFLIIQAYQKFEQNIKSVTNQQALTLPSRPQTNTTAPSVNRQTVVSNTEPSAKQWPDYMKTANKSVVKHTTSPVQHTNEHAIVSTNVTSHVNKVSPKLVSQNQSTDIAEKNTTALLNAANADLSSDVVKAASDGDIQAQQAVVEAQSIILKSNKKTQQIKSVTTTNKAMMKDTHELKAIYAYDAPQLLKTNAEHYAIQLAGSHDIDYLKNQYTKVPLKEHVYFFKTRLNGKAWYVAIYGNYKTAALARKAISTLAPNLQANHPWPRSYHSIQQAIEMS